MFLSNAVMTSMCPNMSKPDLTFLNLEHRWTGSKAAGTFTWLNLWKNVGYIDHVTTVELYYYHHYSCMYVVYPVDSVSQI